MSFLKKFISLRICFAASAIVSTAYAADRVVGANATLDIEPGARSAALGSATLAVEGDYLGLGTNAYQLTQAKYMWASFSHTAYYEDTKYDYASMVIPLPKNQGLGVSFSRFGADDIPYIREGDPLPEGSDYNTLSIADWVFSVAWGRRIIDRLDLGLAFHVLYRDMDQSGWGFRGDASARYQIKDDFYVAGLLKGWTSSATSWESGEFEYSSPEFYLALSYSLPVQYLYGKFNFYWQSAGFFHREARDLDFETDTNGKRIWENPLDWLSGCRGGVEFAFDFGLKLRAGLSSFTTFKSVTAGAGLTIAKFLVVDYAFESHPVFSPVHRVSVSFSPYLFGHKPREEGHLSKTAAAKKLVTEEEVPAEDFVEERVQEPVAPQVEPVVETVAPVDSVVPAADVPLVNPGVNEPKTSTEPTTSTVPQTPVQAPVTPASTTPIIETDDEILE
ncbi:hypothetical protein [Fibrobacter sp. UWB11]|uniref:hypothetical protein n=1 Tax=Fibrobacter sp. UWB11 TaxID=1896202 RepID=UPI0009258FF5|nr:hypothetical protein [Fibrobacter sp. UWB11]SIN88574.1 hypothetical protein SAMN05720758_0408 [Fibrobacter sp. UWB11]